MPVKPFGYRLVHLVPFRAGGVTASGIELQHHAKLPPIYGRVTAVSDSCRETRVGDWVLFEPNRPIRLKHSEGVTFAIDERQILGIVEPGDGDVWFRPQDDPANQLVTA